MRILKLFSAAAIAAVLLPASASAQVDPHFTQYYVYPSFLNPALTGAFDGHIRVSGIYRSQWGNIASPFQTPGFAVDFTTNKNANFGISMMNQRAGDGGYSYTTAYGNMSYTGVRFGAAGTHVLAMGFQLGIIQRRFDPAKSTFGDEWDAAIGYRPGTTRDILNNTNNTSFDVGVGALYYDATPGKKANFFGGFSAAHLTRPKDNFSLNMEAKYPVRWIGHAGVRLSLGNDLSLTPNALYMRQGNAEEKAIGAYLQKKTSASTDFMFGANYRFNDAVAPYIGFGWNGLTLGASYDINVSDLGKIARGSNAFEISLTFIGKRSTSTPEKEFICPRL
jgi:type IX secretion system PorP/SprF family membrane protein